MDAQHETAPVAVHPDPAPPMSTTRMSTAQDPTAQVPTAQIPAPRTGGRNRSGPRPVPELSQDHAHLDLDALRTYRSALTAEEGNVSYWRRIIQARLDVVRDGRTAGGTAALSAEHLRPVLDGARVRAGRTALVQVLPVDDIPPLPDLAELWERRVADDDADGLVALEQDLARAEGELSAYRTALHARLGDATGELIARYRAQPGLCLTALPGPAVPRQVARA